MARKNYVAIPPKSLKTDVLSTDSTFKIRDILWYTGSDGVDVNLAASDFGSDNVGYGVFEPKTAREEWFTFSSANMATAVTGGLTITARGLIRTAPYTTEATARKFNHESGSQVLLYTNSPAFYDDFANKDNDETITGLWTFPTGANYPKVGATYSAPTTDEHVATKKYADDLAIAGAPDGTTTVKGIVEIATGPELAAGTATGGTGATIVPGGSSFKGTSAGAGDANKVPVLNSSGVLDASFLISTILPDYGDGSDGDVTISVPTTLTRDMFYNNLILNADVDSANFRIFVKGTTTRASGVKVTCNGGAGGAGGAGTNPSAGVAGAAGVAIVAGSMPGGVDGLIGAVGVRRVSSGNFTEGTAGVAGSAGSSQSPTVVNAAGTAGGAGGAVGGAGTYAGGAGGAGGAITRTKSLPFSFVRSTNLFEYGGGTFTPLKVTGQSGSGGGGAVATYGTGMIASSGGGGGSGSTAGRIFFISKNLVINGTGTVFEAKGGAGGAGGAGHVTDIGFDSAAGTGGGGGSGGNGGEIYIKYQSLTGTIVTDVTGGAGGAAGEGVLLNRGTSFSLSPLPAAGAAGNAGLVITLTT